LRLTDKIRWPYKVRCETKVRHYGGGRRGGGCRAREMARGSDAGTKESPVECTAGLRLSNVGMQSLDTKNFYGAMGSRLLLCNVLKHKVSVFIALFTSFCRGRLLRSLYPWGFRRWPGEKDGIVTDLKNLPGRDC
jgi:hypothetical protein